MTKQAIDKDILIVGGGLAGAALALAISRFGQSDMTIGLVEQGAFDWRSHDGRAYAMSAASIVFWEQLGFQEKLTDTLQPMVEIDVSDSELETPFRQSFLHFENQIEGGAPASFMMEHSVIGPLVEKAVKATKNIQLYENHKVVQLETHNQYARLGFKEGHELTAHLVVGADGRNSTLRKLAGIKTVELPYDQYGLVMTVELDKPHHGKAVQHFLPSGPFAILPLTGNRASLVWTEQESLANQYLSMSQDELEVEIAKRFTPQLGGVRLVSKAVGFPLSLSLARELIKPHFALVGDAAHAVHPIAGLGLNMGLRDVAALTQVIVERQRLGLDIGGFSGLEEYSQWRRFDSASSALAMDGLNRLFSNDVMALRQLRSFGLRLVDRIAPLKALFVKEAAGLNGDVPKLMRGEDL